MLFNNRVMVKEKIMMRLTGIDELFNRFEAEGWYDNADRDLAEGILFESSIIEVRPLVQW